MSSRTDIYTAHKVLGRVAEGEDGHYTSLISSLTHRSMKAWGDQLDPAKQSGVSVTIPTNLSFLEAIHTQT